MAPPPRNAHPDVSRRPRDAASRRPDGGVSLPPERPRAQRRAVRAEARPLGGARSARGTLQDVSPRPVRDRRRPPPGDVAGPNRAALPPDRALAALAVAPLAATLAAPARL